MTQRNHEDGVENKEDWERKVRSLVIDGLIGKNWSKEGEKVKRKNIKKGSE